MFCNAAGRSDIQFSRLSPILIALDISFVIFLQNQLDSIILETNSPFVQLEHLNHKNYMYHSNKHQANCNLTLLSALDKGETLHNRYVKYIVFFFFLGFHTHIHYLHYSYSFYFHCLTRTPLPLHRN